MVVISKYVVNNEKVIKEAHLRSNICARNAIFAIHEKRVSKEKIPYLVKACL